MAYDVGELDEVVTAYATRVPRAQGSEDPAVVIPLVTQHYAMLRRNLIYTAVTRGQRLVVIVGQPKALALAVKGSRTRRRWGAIIGLPHRVGSRSNLTVGSSMSMEAMPGDPQPVRSAENA